VERIFISSLARGDMGSIRQAARRAVEALEMYPVMFETGPPSDEGSRRALLDRVASADALLLLLGGEYGEAGGRGMSPTEEEFSQAVETGVPVLALVQDTPREPAQDAFLRRVRGGWEQGRLTADFTDAADVGFAVTRALNAWRRQREGGDVFAGADARALALARGEDPRASTYGAPKLRVAVAPAVGRPLLDAVALRDADLPDDLADAARSSRLAPHSAAINTSVGRESITLALSGGRGGEPIALRVGFDGSAVGEGPVGGDELGLGGSAIMADRARDVIARTLAFAEAVWRRIDQRDEVREVSVTCAVPAAQHKVYALEPIGNSMRMPMSMPDVVVAPDPPLRTRRAELGRVVDRLEAELQRAFAAEGAVHPPPAGRETGWV
jgi:hypothetical protein